MKVFLSSALPNYEDLLPSRLRANALAYNVEVVVPNSDIRRHTVKTAIRNQIRSASAVIALVAQNAPEDQLRYVNWELQVATIEGIPVIGLVESHGLIQNLPESRTVIFDRFDFGKHQKKLRGVWRRFKKNKRVRNS